MPIGYLVTVVLAGSCTFVALVPVRLPVLGSLSLWSGLIVDGLPFVVFYYLLASTALAIAQGQIGSPVGRVALALAFLSTVGLALIVRRRSLTRPAAAAALAGSLGAGAARRTGARRGLPLGRILLRPIAVRGRSIERVANISYGDRGTRNLFDLYRRRSGSHGGPALIHLHGGRFVRGKKGREALPLLYELASQGWVCISANYRLRPAVGYPDDLIDLEASDRLGAGARTRVRLRSRSHLRGR